MWFSEIVAADALRQTTVTTPNTMKTDRTANTAVFLFILLPPFIINE
jgi:hypothetical protein